MREQEGCWSSLGTWHLTQIHSVYTSYLVTHILNLGVVCANYINSKSFTRMTFLVTLGEGVDVLYEFHGGTGHWFLADEALVKRDRDPCPQKGQDSVICCLAHSVRGWAIGFGQSHRLTTVDDNIKTELGECLRFFSGQMELFWGFLLYDKLWVYEFQEDQVITPSTSYPTSVH